MVIVDRTDLNNCNCCRCSNYVHCYIVIFLANALFFASGIDVFGNMTFSFDTVHAPEICTLLMAVDITYFTIAFRYFDVYILITFILTCCVLFTILFLHAVGDLTCLFVVGIIRIVAYAEYICIKLRNSNKTSSVGDYTIHHNEDGQ